MNSQSPISSADSLDMSESSGIMMNSGTRHTTFPDTVGRHDPAAISNKKRAPLHPPRSGGALRPPPKRFKSSFIFFSIEKHQEYKEKFASEGDVPKGVNITKLVAEAWRTISPEDKANYEKLAFDDKQRYEKELLNYKDESGNVIPPKKRSKDPNAPKRPMSAFLAFANSRRAEVKANHPKGTNGEISKLLSKMWKELSEEDQKEYREKEAVLWSAYREEMKAWRRKNDKRRINTAKTSDHYPAYKDRQHETDIVLESRPNKQARTTTKKTDMDTSFRETTFEEHFAGLAGGNRSGSFLEQQAGLPQPSSHEDHDVRVASAALRGVRGATGSNLFPQEAINNTILGSTSTAAGVQGGHLPIGMLPPGTNNTSPHLAHHQLESILGGLSGRLGGGAGALFHGAQHLTSATPGGTTSHDLLGNSSSSFVNRTLLDLGLPYQTFGGASSGTGTTALGTRSSADPAVLIAQAALQGATAASNNTNQFNIPGFTEPVPAPLAAQLASLAAGHHPGMGLATTYNTAAGGSFQLAELSGSSTAGTRGALEGNHHHGESSSTNDHDSSNPGGVWPHLG
eukprot:Nitzschia sp. Nitz4//scaffold4_size323378//217227//219427//NITZ4_000684-RA/size323378-snap-gene-0.464-mRNA-1//-1//CDS//3329553471//9091//frame0